MVPPPICIMEPSSFLDGIPDEVLGLICEQCDPTSIQHLRSTSRRLRRVAGDYLCPDIRIDITQASVDRLMKLGTMSPSFTNAPQQLVLSGDTLAPWNIQNIEDSRDFCHFQGLRQKEANWVAECCPASRKERLKHLLDIATVPKQGRVLQREIVRTLLAQHVSLCAQAIGLLREYQQSSELGWAVRLVLQTCANINTLHLQTNRTWPIPHANGVDRTVLHRLYDEQTSFDLALAIFQTAVLAAHAAGKAFTKMVIDGMPRYTSSANVEHLKRPWRNNAAAIFAEVEELSWKLLDTQACDRPRRNALETERVLMRCLRHTTNLRVLELRSSCYSPHLQVHEVIGQSFLPLLVTLKLCSVSVWTPWMIGFLLRQKHGLRDVRLAYVDFIDCDWQDFIIAIAGKFAQLQSCKISGNLPTKNGTDNVFLVPGCGATGSENVQLHPEVAACRERARQLETYVLTGQDCPDFSHSIWAGRLTDWARDCENDPDRFDGDGE